MDMARLEWHLGNWADWMRRPSNKLGYPTHSLCIANGGGSTVDAFEIMCEEVDAQCARAMDAMIDSLPPNQAMAINHKWLASVYRMRDMETAYEMALDNLLTMAERRGMV
jgi:hypothetical protein